MINKKISLPEYVFTVLSLIIYSEGIIAVTFLNSSSEGDIKLRDISYDEHGVALIKMMYLFIYIISFWLLTKCPKNTNNIVSILSKNIYILALVGLAAISGLWSELPFLTITRAGSLAGTTIFGIYLANRYTLRQQLLLLKNTFLAIVLLSIVFAIALPQYGIMGGIHTGAWRGIYTHKNGFGKLLALAAIIFILQLGSKTASEKSAQQHRFSKGEAIAFGVSLRSAQSDATLPPTILQGRGYPNELRSSEFLQTLLTYLGLGLSILLLVLSRSSGGVVVLALTTIVLLLLKIRQLSFHDKFIAIVGAIVLLCIVLIILVPNPENLFTSFGKSSDLTGRWVLWNILVDRLSQSPLIGFGYEAFWQVHGLSVAADAAWDAPSAHNGFLDLTLSVGILGLVIFIINYISTFAKSYARFCYFRNNEALYPLMLLIYLVTSNISESGLFAYNNIFWLLYTTVSYSVVTLKEKDTLALPQSSTI
jgi:exopolysaccharide production protein ExoQ